MHPLNRQGKNELDNPLPLRVLTLVYLAMSK
jgi:hypothetical protein